MQRWIATVNHGLFAGHADGGLSRRVGHQELLREFPCLHVGHLDKMVWPCKGCGNLQQSVAHAAWFQNVAEYKESVAHDPISPSVVTLQCMLFWVTC